MEEKEDFKTLIDKVVDLIQQTGSASIEEIARTLAIEESRVEKLALLLEDSGLITIRYSFLFPSKTVLVAKDVKKGKLKSLLADTSKMKEMLDSIDEKVSSSEKAFLVCEGPLLDKLKEAEDILTALDVKLKNCSDDEASEILKETERLSKLTNDFEKERDQLSTRLKTFRNRLKNTSSNAIAKRKKSASLLVKLFKIFKK